MTQELFTIQEVAKILRVTPKTLRRWEEAGLIKPIRTMGNQRRYRPEDVRKLERWRKLQKVKQEALKEQTFPIVQESKPATSFVPEDTNGPASQEPIVKSSYPIIPQVIPTEPVHITSIAKLSPVVKKQECNTPVRQHFYLAVGGIAMLLFLVIAAYVWQYAGYPGLHRGIKGAETRGSTQAVLAATSQTPVYNLEINIPSIFGKKVTFLDTVGIKKELTAAGGIKTNNANINAGSGKLTASNVIYSIHAGSNITITGDRQNPTISAGVTLTAGTGLSVSGSTITNTDLGSAQNIFKTFTVGTTNISAGSNNDTVTFAAGSGISLSGDTSSKTITISSSGSSSSSSNSFWQDTSGIISPKTATDDLVLGGTTVATSKLAFTGDSSGIPTFTLTNGSSGTTYLDATGVLGTTGNQTLQLKTAAATGVSGGISLTTGNSSTSTPGDITIDTGSGVVSGTPVVSDTFEGSGTGSVNDWNIWFNDTLAASNTVSHSGNYSLAITETGGFGWGIIENYGAFNVTAGHQYLVTAWFRAASTPETINGTIYWIGGSTSTNLTSITDTTTGWTEMTADVLAPPGSTQAYVSFGDGSSVNGRIQYLDDFDVEDLSAVYTPAINIGATNAEALTIGNVNAAGATKLLGGGGGITIAGGTGSSINIGTTNTNNIAIGTTIGGYVDLQGKVGINTAAPLATLDVRANYGTLPIASISGNTSSAGVVVNNAGVGDLFTASSSGSTKFIIQNDGTLVSGKYAQNNGLIYTNGSGVFQQLTPGGNGTCLAMVGGTLGWSTCVGGGGSGFFTESTGALSPITISDDLLLGGAATDSAKFAFTNNAPGSGTPTASISGVTAGSSLYLTGNGVVSTTNKQTLTLGSASTGNIVLNGFTGTNSVLYTESGTGVLTAATTGTPALCLVSGASGPSWGPCTSGSGLSKWTQDNTDGVLYPDISSLDVLFGGVSTASAKFAFINNAPGSGTPTASISAVTTNNAITIDANGNIGTTNRQTLTLGTATTGNLAFYNFGAGAVQTDANGNLTTGTLSVANGGTGNNWSGVAKGSMPYFSNTGVMGTFGSGTAGQILQSNGSGSAPGWVDASTIGVNYWQSVAGSLSPLAITNDLLLGGTATNSAKFAVLNMAGGTPTATVAGNLIVMPYTSGTHEFGGSLGIGTTSPSDLLDIEKNNGTDLSPVFKNISLGLGTTITAQANAGPARLFVQNTNSGQGWYIGQNGSDDFTLLDSVTTNTPFVVKAGAPNNSLYITGTGSTGIGTSSPLATLDVQGNSGTTPVASVAGSTAKAALVVDNSGVGDIFTASKSGASKFTILNNGNVQIANLTINGGLLYTTTTGTVAQTLSGGAGQILESNGGGSPVWVDASTVGINYWQSNAGTLSPLAVSNDLLLGGTSTNSARFAFINNAGGTPTASIAGNLSLAVPTGANPTSLFNILNGGSLNFRTSPGGDAGLNSVLYIANNGYVGIGQSNPQTYLDIQSASSNTTPINLTTTTNLSGDSSFIQYNNRAMIGYEGDIASAVVRGMSGKGVALEVNAAISSIPFYIDQYQHVMIGQNAVENDLTNGIGPTAQLTIGGDASMEGQLVFYSTPEIQSMNKQTLQLGGNLTGDIQFKPGNSGSSLYLSSSGNVGIGTTSPTLFALQVAGSVGPDANDIYNLGSTSLDWSNIYARQGNFRSGLQVGNFGSTVGTGTTPVASIAGSTSFAGMVVDNSGLGDLFTASNSGASKFTILNNGNVQIANFTANGGVLYTNGSGTVAQTAAGSLGQCLESNGGGAPNWQTCAAGINLWQGNLNALSPANSTYDLLLGGTATASAKFAFLNNAGGTPVASVSANSGNIATYLTGDGTLGTTNRQSLVLGNSAAYNTTGNILLNPNGTGNVGIGTTALGGTLSVVTLNATGTGSSAGINLTANSLTSGDGMSISSNSLTGGNLLHLSSTSTQGNGMGGLFINISGANTNSSAENYGQYTQITNTGTNSQNVAGYFSATGATYNYGLLVNKGIVGIGTTIPSAQLEVDGTYGSNGALIVNQLNSGDIFDASSSGATKFVINNNGNVGIGTSTPGYPLDIQTDVHSGSSLHLQNTDAVDGRTVLQFTNNVNTNKDYSLGIDPQGNTSKDFALRDLSAAGAPIRLAVSTLGNLEIGNNSNAASNALATLDIRGNNLGAGTLPTASISANSSFAGLVVDNSGSGDLFTASSSGLNRFVITQAGNVGIGTATPGYKLDVNGDINLAGSNTVRFGGKAALEMSQSGNTQTQLVNFTAGGSISLYADNLAFQPGGHTVFSDGNTGDTIFNTYSSDANNAFQLQNLSGTAYFNGDSLNGRIGIGAIPDMSTKNLLGTLDVRANSGTIATASVSGATSFAGMVVDNSGVGDLFTASKSGATKFVITNSGNVGIGTTTISNTLQVAGSIGLTSLNQYQGMYIGNGTNTIIDFKGFNSGNDNGTIQLYNSGTVYTHLTAYGTSYLNGGNLGIGTSSPVAPLHVNGTYGGNAAAVINQQNSGDIFVASQAGNTKFVIANDGTVHLNNYGGTNNSMLFADNSVNGILTKVSTNTSGLCLVSGGSNPSWTSCGATGIWNINAGAIVEGNTTEDLLLGSTATSSATFAFLNNAGGTPTASIAGNLSLVVPTGANPAAKVNILNGGSLSFQTSNGGDSGLITNLQIAGTGIIATGTLANGVNNVSANTITANVAPSSGLTAGSNLETVLQSTGTSTASIFGTLNQVQYNTGQTGNYSATVSGAINQVSLSGGSGNFTQGIYGAIDKVGIGAGFTGTVTNAYGVYGEGQVDGTGLSTGNLYAMYAGDAQGSGTIGTQYGLYIQNLTRGNTNYELYVAGGESYFGGNIGIGATNPLATLDIRGNSGTTPVASFSGATTFANTVIDQSGSGAIFTASKSGATKFVINNAGNVGIGNTIPTANLDVVGSSNNASTDTLHVESLNKNGYFYANYNASAATPYATIGGYNTLTSSFVSTNFNQGGVTIGNATPAAPGLLNVEGNNTGGNALVNINQNGSADIFTASSAGIPKFTITNAGGIRLGTNEGLANQCLLSGGAGQAAIWGTCPGTAMITVTKPSNQSVSNTTLTNDNALVYNQAANQTWTFQMVLYLNISTNTTFKLDVTAPSGATCTFGASDSDGTGSGFETTCGGGPITYTGIGNGPNVVFFVNGTVTTGSTAGNVQLQWAENTAGGTSTVDAGSFLTANEVGATNQVNYWQLNASINALSPASSAYDLMLGGNATNSAKFDFSGNAGSLNPVASIAAIPSSGTTNGLSLSGNGTIQSLNRNTLTLGGNSTGDISFQPGGVSSGNSLYLASNGNVGIGTKNPGASLEVDGSGAAFNGNLTTESPTSGIWEGIFGGTDRIIYGAAGSPVYEMDNYTGTGSFRIFRPGVTPDFIDTQGFIGINTSSQGNNSLVVNQPNGSGDIFSASQSGNTKFTIQNNGNVSMNSGGTSGGGLTLLNSSSDEGLFLDNTGAGGQDWVINSASNGTLTNPGTLSFFTFSNNPLLEMQSVNTAGGTGGGQVGINIPSSAAGGAIHATMDVRGNLATQPVASFSGSSNFAGLLVDNSGSGDLFTASSSGQSRFTIQQNGTIVLGADGTTPVPVTLRGGAAGGTNTAGSDLTLAASDGTGTGGSGNLVFSTAPSMMPQLEYQNQDYDGSDAVSSENDSWNINLLNNHQDEVLIVAVYDSGTLGNNTSVTDCPTSTAPCGSGGKSFTKITSVQDPSSGGEVVMWYLKNPYPNISYIQPNLTAAAYVTTGITEYYNVNQTTPVATSTTNSGTGTSVSKTLSSTSVGQLVVDAVGTYNFHTDTQGSGQTETWNAGELSGSYKAAAGSTTTMSWTIDSSDNYGQILAALNSDSTTTSANTITPAMTILPNGNVGIGTATPSARLTIVSNASALNTSENFDNQNILDLTSLGANNTSLYMGVDAPSSAGFIQASQKGLVDFLSLNPRGGSVGIGVVQANAQLEVNGIIQVDNPQGSTTAPTLSAEGQFAFADVGSVPRLYFYSGGSRRYINYTGTGDYSEYFLKDNPQAIYPTGYIMSMVDGNVSPAASSSAPLGVISAFGTRGFDSTGDRITDHNYANVGLLGHLPVIVSNENGEIQPGDLISAESIYPGVGTKNSQKPKIIVGTAIQPFTPSKWSCPAVSSMSAIVWPADVENENQQDICYQLPNGTYVGRIMVEVSPTWYDPSSFLTATGNLNLYSNGQIDPTTGIASYGLKTLSGQTYTSIGEFSDAAIGNLSAGSIKANDMVLRGKNVNDQLNKIDAMASSEAQLTSQVDYLNTKVASLEGVLNGVKLITTSTTIGQQQPNGTGTSSFSLDTTSTNPVANPGLEQPLNLEWTTSGYSTIRRITTDAHTGSASLQITGSEPGDGTRNTLTTTLEPSTTYTLSWYIKSGSVIPNGSITAAYSYDGADSHQTAVCGPLSPATEITTDGWQLFSCQFTTTSSAPTASNAIFIEQTDSTLRTYYIDDVAVSLANKTAITDTNSLHIIGASPSATLDASPSAVTIEKQPDGSVLPYEVKDVNGTVISNTGVFSETVIGNLRTGVIDAQNINTQSLVIAGQNVNDRLNALENTASNEAELTNTVNALSSDMIQLKDKVASLEATFSLLASGSALLNTPTTFVASSAAALGLEKLNASDVTISNSLSVLGQTTVADLGVTGRVTIGLLGINGLDQSNGAGQAYASINTSSGPLMIQPEGLNGVDFLNGKVKIDTNGDVHTQGEITANKININTQSVESASLGQGTLKAGETSVTINTTAVGNNSAIFVTPKTKTDQPLSVTSQTAGKSFTVEVTTPALDDIKFNWWIVN